MRQIVFTNTDGFFDDLVIFLTAVFTYLLAKDAYEGKPGYYLPDDSIPMYGKKITNELIFTPAQILKPIFEGDWPAQIVVNEQQVQPIPARFKKIPGQGSRSIYWMNIQGAFIHYYESFVESIKQKKSGGSYKWPEPWNFARIIRNALAHNACVFFENTKALPVEWRGLIYCPADNGRAIREDVSAVDLIYLMSDMEKARISL